MLHQYKMWSVGDSEENHGAGQLLPGAVRVYSSHDLLWIFHAFEGVQDGFCPFDICESGLK